MIYANKISASIYASASMYGCDRILKSTLDLDDDLTLPITIPHGIDFHHLKTDLDLHRHEPVYVAFRDDIAERVAKFKTVLKFPHPWLLIVSEQRNQKGHGTLFIAPPPSLKDFEATLSKILVGDFPKPWGVLIKDRGAQPEDFLWWEMRGFTVHSAGSINDNRFFYKLRDIFVKYASVASPNMSSAVIFAVAMNRAAYALPNVRLEQLDVFNIDEIMQLNDFNGQIANVWHNLLSTDLAVARSQAEDLLGTKYMADPEELKIKLINAITSIEDKPVHLFPLNGGLVYKICAWLIGKGVSLQKFFPTPVPKIVNRILFHFRLNKLTIIIGSDFSHYGILGDDVRLELRKVFAFTIGKGAKPGHAVRG
jgi:hypothetical protein